jgi:hypothetical protein
VNDGEDDYMPEKRNRNDRKKSGQRGHALVNFQFLFLRIAKKIDKNQDIMMKTDTNSKTKGGLG